MVEESRKLYWRMKKKKWCWQYCRPDFYLNLCCMTQTPAPFVGGTNLRWGPVITAWPAQNQPPAATACRHSCNMSVFNFCYFAKKANLGSVRPRWKLTSKEGFDLFWTIWNQPPKNCRSHHRTGSIARIFIYVYSRRHNHHSAFIS